MGECFFENFVRRVESLPGVQSAAVTLTLPATGWAGTPVQVVGQPLAKLNERPIATISTVTPGYFRTLEIPLQRGREFNEQDIADAQRVAVIDEALARRFWPEYPLGQDPIGQSLLVGGVNPKPAQIVGIAAHVHQNLENTTWPETVYVAYAQSPQPAAMLAVRTESAPLSFTAGPEPFAGTE